MSSSSNLYTVYSKEALDSVHVSPDAVCIKQHLSDEKIQETALALLALLYLLSNENIEMKVGEKDISPIAVPLEGKHIDIETVGNEVSCSINKEEELETLVEEIIEPEEEINHEELQPQILYQKTFTKESEKVSAAYPPFVIPYTKALLIFANFQTTLIERWIESRRQERETQKKEEKQRIIEKWKIKTELKEWFQWDELKIEDFLTRHSLPSLGRETASTALKLSAMKLEKRKLSHSILCHG